MLPLDAALPRPAGYDWLLFTSVNGVARVRRACWLAWARACAAIRCL